MLSYSGSDPSKCIKINSIDEFLSRAKDPEFCSLSFVYLNLGFARLAKDGFKLILNKLQNVVKNNLHPKNIRLNLSNNNLKDKGAEELATALENGLWKICSIIDLGGNNITDIGANRLWRAMLKLKNQDESCHHQLNLHYNLIGDKGLASLGVALQDANFPSNVTLNLQRNNITDEGAQHFWKQLSIIKSSRQVSLDLSDNPAITENSVYYLLDTIQTAIDNYKTNPLLTDDSFPAALKIKINTDSIGCADENRINSLCDYHEALHALNNCLVFCSGTKESCSLISYLPSELLYKISSLVFPFQPNHMMFFKTTFNPPEPLPEPNASTAPRLTASPAARTV